MAIITVRPHLQADLASFHATDVDARLSIIWQAHQSVGQAFVASLPIALFSQSVQLLIRQWSQISQEDQLAVLRDILAGADTRFTQAYKRLNINMKLVFWHRLLTGHRLDFWLSCCSLTPDHYALLARLSRMDLNERLNFLRCALA
ncbi:MAG: orange carotenoid protein N-terminal domain-containing protein [Nodosilinea sp.]